MSSVEMGNMVKKRDIRALSRPIPTGKEIKISSQKMLVSKTNAKGVITYGNENFVDISGYSESELIGSPHNILRHSDMPKAIFYLMWQRITRGRNIMAVVKNLSKMETTTGSLQILIYEKIEMAKYRAIWHLDNQLLKM